MIDLRDYQKEAIKAILEEYRRGVKSQLVVLPTGAGKTVVAAALAAAIGGRTLFLVHRDELARQAEEKISIVWPEASVGIVKAERNDIEAQVVVASVQTISRAERLRQLTPDFKLIITDEAHHAVAPQWRIIYEYIEAGRRNLHIGITATPNRTDQRGLGKVFEKVVYQKTIKDLIEAGYLVPPKQVVVKTEADLDVLKDSGGDLSDRELEGVLNTDSRNHLIVEAFRNHALGRKAIVFAAGVAHARTLADVFKLYQIPAEAIDGETPEEIRRERLQAFGQGSLRVLTNYGVLTEGYDEPSLDAVVLARPTKSQQLYIQMLGRGLRPYPGKKDCLVLDVVDISKRHHLVQLPDLMGVERPEEIKGKSRVGIAGATRAPLVTLFNWMQVAGLWVLFVNRDALVLIPEGNNYKVLQLSKETQRYLTDRALPLPWAQGQAEAKAREMLGGNMRLLEKEAAWRERPVSPRQVNVLTEMRIPVRLGMTSGEASDLISVTIWRRRLLRLRSEISAGLIEGRGVQIL